MNEHFKDTQHHVERAATTAREGIEEELETIENRIRRLVGKEKEPEPGKLEKIQNDLRNLEKRAEGEASDAIESARERLAEYRNSK